jgi:thioesterase domain-containing protein
MLAGYSLGGNIAVDVKHILDKLGIETVAIHLLDSYKMGNTVFNSSHELHFNLPHIKMLLATLKDTIFRKRITSLIKFIKLLCMSEINAEKIEKTELILYRCNDVHSSVKNTKSLGWDDKASNLQIIKVNTAHMNLLNDENTSFLANKMDEKLSFYREFI